MPNLQVLVWVNPATPNLDAKLAALVETADEAAAVAAITEVMPEATVEAPAAPPTDVKPEPVTIDDVRAALKALMDAGKRDQMIEALERYGCKKVSDLSPDVYAEFVASLAQYAE